MQLTLGKYSLSPPPSLPTLPLENLYLCEVKHT